MGTAIITGASAGIGAELARLFAADKHDLVLVARRRDRLDELAASLPGVKSTVVTADLMDPAAPKQIFDAVGERPIDFLVNNAGFGTSGRFWELDLDKERGEVQVNIVALIELTRRFLPGMIARKSGRILNIGSTAGFVPGAFMATYYASKAFVNSFTEALSVELRGTGVTATVSCPGATTTEFFAVAGTTDSKLARQKTMTAPVVAEQAYRAMMKGAPMIVHGARNKFMIWSTRLGPRAMLRSVVASMNQPADGGKQLKD